MFFLVNW